jgi:hypothetical protein
MRPAWQIKLRVRITRPWYWLVNRYRKFKRDRPMRLDAPSPDACHPFHTKGWVYEEKIDGWRMLACTHGRSVQLSISSSARR